MKQTTCSICGRPEDNLVRDHDHLTGWCRGLLCMRCNSGLGMFRDNKDVLISAVIYLQTFESLPVEERKPYRNATPEKAKAIAEIHHAIVESVKAKRFSERRMSTINRVARHLNVKTGALKKALQATDSKGFTSSST